MDELTIKYEAEQFFNLVYNGREMCKKINGMKYGYAKHFKKEDLDKDSIKRFIEITKIVHDKLNDKFKWCSTGFVLSDDKEEIILIGANFRSEEDRDIFEYENYSFRNFINLINK